MSYNSIYSISTEDAQGNTVEYQLLEKGVAAGSGFFPITGSKLRFSLSRFGVGILNSQLTLDIVDDASGTFYDIFNNQLRDKYAVRVLVAGNEIFRGISDWQQIKRFPYKQGKNQIQVVFYNPLMWYRDIGYYESGYDTILAGLTPDTADVPAQFCRFADIFNSLLFAQYGLSGDVLKVAHGFRCENDINTGILGQTGSEVLFNVLHTSANIFDEGINVSDIAVQIANTFGVRIGWSYNAALPMVAKNDLGRNGSTYDFAVLNDTTKMIYNGNYKVNETNGEESATLPEIEESKIVRQDFEPVAEDILAYGTVRYIEPNREFSLDNPNYMDIYALPTFSAPSIQFNPDDSASLRILSGTGSSNPTFPLPGKFRDPEFDNTLYFISELMARLRMDWRGDQRRNFKFHYLGYLDPMENYTTDFDDNVYIITKGEYDLIKGVTIVKDSTSILKTV